MAKAADDDGICPPCSHPDEQKLYDDLSAITDGVVVIITKRNTRNSTAPRIALDFKIVGRGCSWVKKAAAQFSAIGAVIARSSAAQELPHLQYNLIKWTNEDELGEEMPSNRIIRIPDLITSIRSKVPGKELFAHGRMIDAGDDSIERCLPRMPNGGEGESWEVMYGSPDPRPAIARKYGPVFQCMEEAETQAERMACAARAK